MAKNWIQKAVSKNPGALTQKAKKAGLVKGNEKLSKTDLNKLESKAKKSDNTKTLRQVNLAKTLRKFKK